jgi:hypothetical protein
VRVVDVTVQRARLFVPDAGPMMLELQQVAFPMVPRAPRDIALVLTDEQARAITVPAPR